MPRLPRFDLGEGAVPVATGQGAIRRALRLRSIAGALVGVGLSLTLVTVTAEPSNASVIPSPVTGPSSLLGAVTEAGTAAGEVSGAEVVGGALAGLGAYQGTCWVLGKLYHSPDGCSSGLSNILHWNFGASGDDRNSTTTGAWRSWLRGGSCGALTGSCIGGTSPDGKNNFQPAAPLPGYTGSNVAVRVGYTCTNGTSFEAGWGVVSGTNTAGFNGLIGPGSWTNSLWYDSTLAANCGGGSYYTSGGVPYVSTVGKYWYDYGTCSGGCAAGSSVTTPPGSESSVTWTRQSTFVVDAGVGTPWTMTWTQTCTDGTTTSTQTATATWTPSANGTAPTPDLAPCPTGQHVSDVTATGGRGGATELTIDKPTWTSTATTTYPLCTSKAPAGGCFLDLQKNGQSCFSGGVYCAGWIANETRWVMKCEWGPYELATSICEAEYGTTFDFEIQSEPSQGPTTGAGGFPNPSQSPTTGTSGGALPTTGANPSGVPTPYDPTQPGPGGLPAPSPEGANCWGSGWSWDPVSWVYVPVKCSLSWAFVPTTWPTWPSFPWAAPGVPHFTDDCPNLTLNLGHGAGVHNLDICGQITAFEARPLWGTVTAPTLLGGLVTFFFAVRLLEKFEGAVGKGSEE